MVFSNQPSSTSPTGTKGVAKRHGLQESKDPVFARWNTTQDNGAAVGLKTHHECTQMELKMNSWSRHSRAGVVVCKNHWKFKLSPQSPSSFNNSHLVPIAPQHTRQAVLEEQVLQAGKGRPEGKDLESGQPWGPTLPRLYSFPGGEQSWSMGAYTAHSLTKSL